jgi:hypothetical protein
MSSDGTPRERTFICVKPDGVQRGIVGEIIKRFEQKGFKLVALKMMTASEEHLKEHYKDLATKPFFPGLVQYMASGPVVPMVSFCCFQPWNVDLKESERIIWKSEITFCPSDEHQLLILLTLSSKHDEVLSSSIIFS